MKKRIVVGLVLALLLVGTLGFSAAQPNVFASYNKPGNVNLDLVAGYGGWLGVGAQAEVILGKFDIATLPFQWGLMGAGVLDVPFMELGAGGMLTLHLGFSFIPLDFFIGLGVGFDFSGGFFLGLAETSGVAYKLSENLTVLLVDTWLNGPYVYGVGIQLKL